MKTGVPPGARDQGFSFTLETPDRIYLLSAQSDDDRSQWINVIQKVIDKPLTPQDATGKNIYINFNVEEYSYMLIFVCSSGETYKKAHNQWNNEYIFVDKIGLDSS